MTLLATGGTIVSEPGYAVALDAALEHGADYVRTSPDGRYAMLDVHGLARDRRTGAAVRVRYTGRLALTGAAGKVLRGEEGAGTTEFGTACRSPHSSPPWSCPFFPFFPSLVGESCADEHTPLPTYLIFSLASGIRNEPQGVGRAAGEGLRRVWAARRGAWKARYCRVQGQRGRRMREGRRVYMISSIFFFFGEFGFLLCTRSSWYFWPGACATNTMGFNTLYVSLCTIPLY